MKLHSRVAALAGLALATAAATPGQAHHSGAMFDAAHPITLEGTIKDVNWTNPHVSIDFLVEGQGGVGKLWTLEGSSTGIMARSGWTKRTLNPGDRATIQFKPLRDGGPAGSLVSATLANGKTYSWTGGTGVY